MDLLALVVLLLLLLLYDTETIPLNLEPSLFLLRGFLGFGHISSKELIGRVIITDIPKVLSDQKNMKGKHKILC